jgi:predicted XRE-type DNA-binding protein
MAKKINTLEQHRKALGRQIKLNRQVQKISTYGMAKLIGKPQPRIFDIENGKVKDIDTYMKCLEVLGGEVVIRWG